MGKSVSGRHTGSAESRGALVHRVVYGGRAKMTTGWRGKGKIARETGGESKEKGTENGAPAGGGDGQRNECAECVVRFSLRSTTTLFISVPGWREVEFKSRRNSSERRDAHKGNCESPTE
uniref:Uncharacterized protein n=1 Tax=Vespula pensylvanica TaxID=30213 RepID=A0A834KRU1_VESPE|nr:hypothetical protein H0235_013303 [Vespula pensylvanica]